MILINKPMPESCEECMCNDDDYRCGLTGKYFDKEFSYDMSYFEERMPDCPLREADVIVVGTWYKSDMFSIEKVGSYGDKYFRVKRGEADG